MCALGRWCNECFERLLDAVLLIVLACCPSPPALPPVVAGAPPPQVLHSRVRLRRRHPVSCFMAVEMRRRQEPTGERVQLPAAQVGNLTYSARLEVRAHVGYRANDVATGGA